MNDEGRQKGERIAKVMARAGVCSRRDAEKLIAEGRVGLNGKILETPATLITEKDKITVDGKIIAAREETRLWLYHKPRGLVTSHRDEKGRATIFDHLPGDMPRVISVGRLDLDSEGLLLLTNDGELSRKLELPATGWVRRYRVRAHGRTTQEKLDRLKEGIRIDGISYGPIEATLEDPSLSAANMWIEMSLSEGKNREIRRVLEHMGLSVNRLIRISYGPFALGNLSVEAAREATQKEMAQVLD